MQRSWLRTGPSPTHDHKPLRWCAGEPKKTFQKPLRSVVDSGHAKRPDFG